MSKPKELCLTRKERETIEYVTEHGTAITVQFEQIRGGRVRVRSFAPESVKIRRGELPPIAA